LASWPLKMGKIGSSETSARNDHYTVRNISEERRSHVLRGGRLKSRTIVGCLQGINTPRKFLILHQFLINHCSTEGDWLSLGQGVGKTRQWSTSTYYLIPHPFLSEHWSRPYSLRFVASSFRCVNHGRLSSTVTSAAHKSVLLVPSFHCFYLPYLFRSQNKMKLTDLNTGYNF
jgi:hypothetical protein